MIHLRGNAAGAGLLTNPPIACRVPANPIAHSRVNINPVFRRLRADHFMAPVRNL